MVPTKTVPIQPTRRPEFMKALGMARSPDPRLLFNTFRNVLKSLEQKSYLNEILKIKNF